MWISLMLFGTSLVAQASATAKEDVLAKEVAAHSYAINIRADGSLGGAGAGLLGREAAKAQFFMVGEQHGTAGIAQVNLGLHRLASAHGYNHAALEIGPYSTRDVEALVRTGQGRLVQFIRQPGNDFVFPFLGWAEEAALAEQIVHLSPAKAPVLWGIDQEFVGSAALHIARLQTWARSPAQKAVAEQFAAKAAADPLLVGMLEPASYKPLREAFPTVRYPEAAHLIENLAASTAIYAPFAGKGGSRQAANAARETLLKQQFLAHFQQAQATLGQSPKVFFKFGANHAMRGHSLSDVPAFGNFLAEWGLSRGFSMINIAVDCVGGEQSDLRTEGRSPCTPYIDLPADSPLRVPTSRKQLTLFDLRPLRAVMPKIIDPETKSLILAFDFYIPVANPAAATMLVQPTQKAPSK
jgi:hypothetical protein